MVRASSLLGPSCAFVAFVIGCAPAPGFCLDQNKTEAAKVPEGKAPPTALQQFCASNASVIGDARIVWQTSKLIELEAQIRQRLGELEARQAEFAEWLRKREDALKQAAEGVVSIYAHMRPDAAALQLAAMDETIAAAILAKLSSKAAGAIFNEMEVGRAARLSRMMAGPDAAAPNGKKS